MINANDFVLSNVVTREVGYSYEALRAKRNKGVWSEGVYWIKAPDGKIFYNLPKIRWWIISGYEAANDNIYGDRENGRENKVA